jgi:hypothetical protein
MWLLPFTGMKPGRHFKSSPFLGSRPQERNILLYFRGDVGKHRDDKNCVYSRWGGAVKLRRQRCFESA